MPAAGNVTITLHQADGTAKVLKEGLALQAGEVIDATKMDTAALCAFFEQEIQDCFDKKLMMSLHMKATMMKVSDPIIFGHCVKVFFKVVYLHCFREVKEFCSFVDFWQGWYITILT